MVVGAGLAGTGRRDAPGGRLGCDVHALEAGATTPAGGWRTERFDGFVCGPRASRCSTPVTPAAADLDVAGPPARLVRAGRDRPRGRPGAPRGRPSTVEPAVRPRARSPPRSGRSAGRAALAAFSLRAGYMPVDRLLAARDDRPAEEALRARGRGRGGPGAVLPPVPRRRPAGGRAGDVEPVPGPAAALLRARLRRAPGRQACRRSARQLADRARRRSGCTWAPPVRSVSVRARCVADSGTVPGRLRSSSPRTGRRRRCDFAGPARGSACRRRAASSVLVSPQAAGDDPR